MEKKHRNSDFPIGRITFKEDFLPALKDMIFPDKLVEETLYLSESTVKAFKKQAKEQRTSYQLLIGMVLDSYAQRYLIDQKD